MEKSENIFLVIFAIFFLVLVLFLSYQINLGLIKDEKQKEIINFLRYNKELGINFTEKELSHLEDVKKRMIQIDLLFVSLIFINFFLGFYLHQRKKLFSALFLSSFLGAVISFLALFSILINFNWLFTLFHQIFFPQGNWVFPLESQLIEIFPEEFFISVSKKIFVTFLLIEIILLIFAFFMKNKNVVNRKKY